MKVRAFGECKEVLGNQYALSLYALAESICAKDILEIGAGWGWSARAFALSLENRPGSCLVSIDTKPERIHAENRAAVETTGVNWKITKAHSSSAEVAGEFDLIYIDGDPYQAQADFLRFYPKLRPGGLMVMDGYGGQMGPTEAVESLSSSYPFTILPYTAKCCHAIHSRPRRLTEKNINMITCQLCGKSQSLPNWRTADTQAVKHSQDSGHKVNVHIKSRNLSYVIFSLKKEHKVTHEAQSGLA